MSKSFVVLGGGFAGVEAAILLRRYGYEVTLVSNREYMFVYPISIWVPVKKKKFEDVKIPLSKLSDKHGFKLIVDSVERIEHKGNFVQLKNGSLGYDYLFIAMGMKKIMPKGVENTLSICGNPDEAVRIEEELDRLVTRGHGKIAVGFGGNPKDTTKTAVRGGPAFELLFNIDNYLKSKGIRDKFDLAFFAPMKEPGRRMGEKAYSKMGTFFEKRKIKSYKGKKIKAFEKGSVVFEDDSKLESDLTVFISGGRGHDVVINSGLPVDAVGFVEIDEGCKVKGHDNIYAIGDTAALIARPWAAKQGHIAEVMAKVGTYNVHNEIKGTDKRKSYWEKLHILCLMDFGNGAAFVMRDHKKDFIIPMPIVGHWVKKLWGFYYINSKLKRLPRIM